MQVTVFHHDPHTNARRTTWMRVANVAVHNNLSNEQALECGYQLTQNINGSWSQGPTLDNGRGFLVDNDDYDANVRRLAKLHQRDGRTYGLRSTMVGDVLCIDGVAWFEVASFGFVAHAGLMAAEVWPRGYCHEDGPATVIHTKAENAATAASIDHGALALVWSAGPACYPPLPESTPASQALARAMTTGDNS